MKPLNKDEKEKTIKIVLIGLENSGKTSILNCLRGKKRISAFNNPKPTKGLDIQEFEALDSNYAIWDLGGQQSFRDDYFVDFKKYIKDTTKIIYVIDIQDNQRYEDALKYLKQVIDSIDDHGIIDFSVFLHKFDPDLVFNSELNEGIINDLVMNIKKSFPPEFLYSLNKTSIYAVFEKATLI
jgi:small GTP-binding protein